MNNNKLTYIKTTNEAQKYIGKIITCYYYTDHYQEMNNKEELFDPDNNNRHISYMWTFKLTRVSPLEIKNIRYAELYGINTVRLMEYSWYNKTLYDKPILTKHEESKSSAQHYVRLATPQEIKIYLQLNRKFRIYKHD